MYLVGAVVGVGVGVGVTIGVSVTVGSGVTLGVGSPSVGVTGKFSSPMTRLSVLMDDLFPTVSVA
ncbi:hypothetical protein COZ14_01400 [Candidatus Dojkabacteria bacterium CG_4_10_14_3_um_filter_Dojkabacteria_WS6_41_9]|nr:MAG: hypothetical protein COZ14_01400 [Candidatus Dojkabacteria bacterium CG_4_10_14_3_um_filter_Dojkabacteria_WS6_41_9]